MCGFVWDVETPDATAQAFGVKRGATTVDSRQDDREFLTAIARDEIPTATECFIERLRDLAQHFIAARMTVRVVEVFEFVEIQENQRERLLFTPRTAQFALERAIELSAIGDAREAVDCNQSLQSLICRFECESQTRQFFIALLERVRALTHPIFQVCSNAFELGFDLATLGELALQLMRALGNASVQRRSSNQRDNDENREQRDDAERG